MSTTTKMKSKKTASAEYLQNGLEKLFTEYYKLAHSERIKEGIAAKKASFACKGK